MSVTKTWTNPESAPPDLTTGQVLTQTAWEQVLSDLDYLGGSTGSGGTVGSAPSGAVMAYGAGTTDPAGWFLCDGRAVSRTTFSVLFTVVSTTYGTGDGSTTFNIPDLRSRVAMGPDTFGTAAGAAGRASGSVALGNTSGEDTHTLTGTESGTSVHVHANTLTDNNHTHQFITSTGSNLNFTGGFVGQSQQGNATTLAPGVTPMSISNANSGTASAGAAHNNRQLNQILTYIIKQ